MQYPVQLTKRVHVDLGAVSSLTDFAINFPPFYQSFLFLSCGI